MNILPTPEEIEEDRKLTSNNRLQALARIASIEKAESEIRMFRSTRERHRRQTSKVEERENDMRVALIPLTLLGAFFGSIAGSTIAILIGINKFIGGIIGSQIGSNLSKVKKEKDDSPIELSSDEQIGAIILSTRYRKSGK